MKFEIDHNRLQKHVGKLCPCIVPTKETVIQDNICICKEFIKSGTCVCGLFKKLEEN